MQVKLQMGKNIVIYSISLYQVDSKIETICSVEHVEHVAYMEGREKSTFIQTAAHGAH